MWIRENQRKPAWIIALLLFVVARQLFTIASLRPMLKIRGKPYPIHQKAPIYTQNPQTGHNLV